MKASLYRYEETDEGTFGIIVFDGQFLHTGELPGNNNKPNTSCIPCGKYVVRMRVSPKYGKVYEVTGVPKRSYILFHHGNYCGSKEMGYLTNTAGCILLGTRRGKLQRQKALLISRIARRRFETVMNFEPFTLEVIQC